MKKIIAILGPTATGKTELALKLAKKFHGEIISADSRAIYKDLNIGTAKPPISYARRSRVSTKSSVPSNDGTQSYSNGIRIHLVDFLSPKKTFSASDFAKKARKAIAGIRQRGRLPIICGGTGFWIEALLKPGLLPDVPPNPILRKKLEKLSTGALFKRFKKLDPKRAATIDQNNRRRLIRAIEIASARQGEPLSRQGFPLSAKIKILYLGLTLPNPELKQRIRSRFLRWLEQGLFAETKKLNLTVSAKRLKEIGLAYPIIAEYLEKKISRDEMIEKSVNAIYHYGKRQKTWFKKNPNIHWVKQAQTSRLVTNFLKTKKPAKPALFSRL